MSPVSIGPPSSTMARNETVTHNWFVVDASGHIVGRLATQIATVLMGKHRPDYTPHVDTGDYVVVLNAHRIRFSGQSLAHDTHPQFTKKFLWKKTLSQPSMEGQEQLYTRNLLNLMMTRLKVRQLKRIIVSPIGYSENE